MNILLDSNVLIAAYPEMGDSPERTTTAVNTLLQLANENGHATFHHPIATAYDFENITDVKRRRWRQTVTSNYPVLHEPPRLQQSVIQNFGEPAQGSNDWVDHHLLAAVEGDAVHILVTEDIALQRKAKVLGLGERVVGISDAIAAIRAISPRPSDVNLLPEQTRAHALDANDPIFNALREDYHPHFDDWLQKCKIKHRTCWRIEVDGALAALTIVKEEIPPEFGPGGKTLKISLFKVSGDHPGMRYGELLLKSVFDYCAVNDYDAAYVTMFPKYRNIANFFDNFGFTDAGEKTALGETVLEKRLKPQDVVAVSDLSLLEYHIRFGPRCYRTDTEALRFIVPIEPRFYNVLFPEADEQRPMDNVGIMSPAGNGIQKAYLSGSNIRSIDAGSILYFYRSRDRQRLGVIGVAEGFMASSDPEKVAAYVGKRTVYSQKQILELTDWGRKEILAILFRQSKVIRLGPTEEPTDARLREAGVWQRPAQSIMKIQPPGTDWLRRHVDQAEM